MASAARSPFPVDAISIKIHRSPFGMCWRWRTELAVLFAGLAVWLWVSWRLGSYSWSLGVLGGVVLVLALVPWSRRFVVARFWCLFTRHRLQRVFWELRLHTRAGHLPWVLWTRPTPVGVRSWVLCPPGTCSDDFRDSAKEIAAACGGREARVTASHRWSLLIVIDVLRRDLLAPGTTVRSRLASDQALAPVLVPAQVVTGPDDDEDAEPVGPGWPHVGPGGIWS
jgi:hypothetical protein